jgi:hypothetical protein
MVKSVTLKRTITIKAIVTDDFKKYLTYELETSINDIKQKTVDVIKQAKELVASLEQSGGSQDQIQMIQQQLQIEKKQQENTINDLKKRIVDANNLQNNTEFVQGTIDGFTNVKVGDNLYQKLGAMEILIKDGVVEDIRGS